MKKTPLVYLCDIVDSAEKILEYLDGMEKDRFELDTQRQDAVIRRFEIIGEASRSLGEKFRAEYEQIPWKRMVGLRNILIHEYDEVELEEVWKIYESGELQGLIEEVEKIVEKESEG